MMRPPDLEAQLRDALQTQTWAEVDRLQGVLDAQDRAERQRRDRVGLASAALWYAAQGLPVFLLQPRSKVPYPKSHGFKDATCDAGRIRSWWRFAPDANIGIATGHRVDVIDVDGPDGNHSLAQILEELPDRLGWASTPRPGGRHLYVPATGRGNDAAILPGIDYRGLGGYVVAPPSATEQGTYRWVRPLLLPAVEGAAG
jgi:hypothetical protein